ncbi:hypothetical protein DEO72_LG11g2509 [Vigna unguiculata]|uniref:Glycine rich protein n=1 Tax=Vigna unguiculata TaxID=3917 RepID=A0A4D6NQ65_VIGUN|nr:hypothetical protein DEO72_LG11g2509 [Vigna unguiculata]
MAILGASKLLSFATLLGILLLLINSALGAATQPSLEHGRKLLKTYYPYPGGGGWRKAADSGGRGYRKLPYYGGRGYRKPRYYGRGKYTQNP